MSTVDMLFKVPKRSKRGSLKESALHVLEQ